jgi:hypothetical protein
MDVVDLDVLLRLELCAARCKGHSTITKYISSGR